MNAELITALNGIVDNLRDVISILSTMGETNVSEPVPAESTAVEEKTESNVIEFAEIANKAVSYTEEQLDSMGYNDLKKLAKSLGVSATGARDEITKRILGASDATDSTPVVEEKPTKKTTRKSSVAETPVNEEDDDEEEDPVVKQVNEAVADMTDEEILDFLTDVGIKAKGKRQALISAVIKAVHEGKIELDDSEDETEETEVEDEAPAIENEDADEGEEFDPNDSDNPEMTDARRQAILDNDNEVRDSIKNKEISRKDIVEWLNDFLDTDVSKKSNSEVVDMYIYYTNLLIDDDGALVEEGAYTVNGVPYCCGAPLKYNEDDNTFICEKCGTEYEAE